jgi:phage major head subunit gpT-like protein
MALDSAAAVAKLRSLTGKFDNSVKATTPFYPKLCTVIPSDGADEEYGILGSVPAVREWLGSRDFHTPRAAKFTIENKLWESSIGVEKTHIQDDRMGIYATMFESLGVRAARHPDKLLLTDTIVPATAATSLCLDGQIFFDTDHSWGDSGTQDNDLTGAAATGTQPTLAEFTAAANTMLQAMLLFKDDKGQFLHDDVVMGKSGGMELIALVPLNMWEIAVKAFSPGILVGGGDTNVPIISAEVVPTPHFGSGGAYFDLYRVDTPFKPYIFQAREPLSRKMKGMDDIEFKDVKFMTQARYNVGYGAWWNAVRYTFT